MGLLLAKKRLTADTFTHTLLQTSNLGAFVQLLDERCHVHCHRGHASSARPPNYCHVMPYVSVFTKNISPFNTLYSRLSVYVCAPARVRIDIFKTTIRSHTHTHRIYKRYLMFVFRIQRLCNIIILQKKILSRKNHKIAKIAHTRVV